MRHLKKQSGQQDPLSPLRRRALQQFGLMASAAMFAGMPVAHASNPNRIVSIGGALTEIIFALHVEAQLVGVDTTSTFPDAAQKLPSVGYARTLSAEGVLALAPTMLLATEDAGPPAVIRQLSSSGVPVNILPANHRFEGLLERVTRVGILTERKQQASILAQTLKNDWQTTQAQLVDHRKTRVLFILSHTPGQIMVAGKNTSAQAMLEYAAVTNAIDGFSGYKPLTPEAVIAAQPDIILVTHQGLAAIGGINGLLSLPGAAGRTRRVMSFDAMYLLGFGPRLPAALSALNSAITQSLATSAKT